MSTVLVSHAGRYDTAQGVAYLCALMAAIVSVLPPAALLVASLASSAVWPSSPAADRLGRELIWPGQPPEGACCNRGSEGAAVLVVKLVIDTKDASDLLHQQAAEAAMLLICRVSCS